MTTAPLPPSTSVRPVRVSREVIFAAGATVALTVPVVGAAGVVSGSPGATGAAVGVAMVVVFFGFGSLTVDAVATVSPAASLLVALLTYTLQVVAVGVVFMALHASGALGSSVDGGWVAGTLITGTGVWLVGQIFAATRSREPLYDLSPPSSELSRDRSEPSAP